MWILLIKTGNDRIKSRTKDKVDQASQYVTCTDITQELRFFLLYGDGSMRIYVNVDGHLEEMLAWGDYSGRQLFEILWRKYGIESRSYRIIFDGSRISRELQPRTMGVMI